MRPALRWTVAAAALGSWIAIEAAATAPQAPAAPPPPATQAPGPGQTPGQPVFRTGAELVRVDVAVLDRHGVPVSSLTAGDFELEEDGVAQEIRTFQFIRNSGQPNESDDVSLTIRSRSHAASEAAKDNVRLFLIFWDEYHIGQMVSANRARSYLMHFVRTAFGPTDIVGFMDPLTPIDAISFTRDRLELAEHVRRLVGRSGVYVPTRSAVEDAHLQQGDVERLRSEVTMSAVKSAAVHLGGMREGRKSLILISEGLRGIQRDATRLMTDLTRAANDNNTAIYAVDPRGLGQNRFPSLWESIATDTGGDFYRSNDLERAFKQVVVESSGFYLLGYQPSAERRLDGRFHKIKVKVKPSGLDVRARNGYWAPSVAEVERARVKAAAAELPADMTRALSELPGATARRTVDFWAGISAGADQPMVRLSWTPRPAPPGSPRPSQVSAVVSSGSGTVFEGAVETAGTAFAAAPGPLKVTFTVLDETNDIIDRDSRQIEVPDQKALPLWLSTPVVLRAQNVREFRSLDRGPNATPYAGREFERTDRLVIRFSLHGTAAAGAAVSARMLSQWGKDLTELPLSPRAVADAPYEIDLPLSTVARGDYVVALTATSGEERTRVLVPMRVVR